MKIPITPKKVEFVCPYCGTKYTRKIDHVNALGEALTRCPKCKSFVRKRLKFK